MTNDDRLRELLQSALSPTSDEVQPPRDLWPALARRLESPRKWVWFEVSLAAAVVLGLLMFPDWFFLLLYHL
jgi:hypothetical protein